MSILFWVFGLKACGILTSRPRIKPAAPALEGRVLTIGPSGTACRVALCLLLWSPSACPRDPWSMNATPEASAMTLSDSQTRSPAPAPRSVCIPNQSQMEQNPITPQARAHPVQNQGPPPSRSGWPFALCPPGRPRRPPLRGEAWEKTWAQCLPLCTQSVSQQGHPVHVGVWRARPLFQPQGHGPLWAGLALVSAAASHLPPDPAPAVQPPPTLQRASASF